jgi:hypothetical protein
VKKEVSVVDCWWNTGPSSPQPSTREHSHTLVLPPTTGGGGLTNFRHAKAIKAAAKRERKRTVSANVSTDDGTCRRLYYLVAYWRLSGLQSNIPAPHARPHRWC